MHTGTVKWFNTTKGFGFIKPQNGDDVFVHITAVQRAQLNTLMEGQVVQFDISTDEKTKKQSAVNLKILDRQ